MNAVVNSEFTTENACKANVVQWQVNKNGQFIDLRVLMHKLADFGVNNIWCESGERLGGALLAAKLVDELIIYQAPKLMGPSARPLMSIPDYTSMTEIPQFRYSKVEIIGDDIKLILSDKEGK